MSTTTILTTHATTETTAMTKTATTAIHIRSPQCSLVYWPRGTCPAYGNCSKCHWGTTGNSAKDPKYHSQSNLAQMMASLRRQNITTITAHNLQGEPMTTTEGLQPFPVRITPFP